MQRKIGIDCRMIEHSGIGIRIESIVESILENNKIHEIYLFGSLSQLNRFSKYNVNIIEYNAKIYGIRELFGHKKMMEMDLLDIPHFNVPIFYLQKSIVTIHDVIPFKMKQYYKSILKQIYLKLILSLIRLFAKKIIAVSEFTKNDLIDSFSFPEKKIQVIYNGVDKSIFYPRSKSEISRFQKKYSLPKKYFLTVGIGKEHKNLQFLISALGKDWTSKKVKIPLVIAGSGGSPPDYIKNEIAKFKDYIIVFPKIKKEELPILYSAAYFFIYPSLYEGFGFPVVEAQAVGCPLMSSNASVLPEILQNSAYFFDPRDMNDFLEVFHLSLKTEISRKKNISKGLTNVKRFSWEKSAEKILEIYST